MNTGVLTWLRRLSPAILLVVLAVVGSTTDVFGTRIQEIFGSTLVDTGKRLLPSVVNLIISLCVFSVAWASWSPVKTAVAKLLEKGQASPAGKNGVNMILRLLYWPLAIFLCLGILSPGLMSQLALSVTLIAAALTLAMKDAAGSLIAGITLQFNPHVRIGDEIEVVGLAVKGKVVEIGILSTVVETDEERTSVANGELTKRAIKVFKPKKPVSSIIIP